jgi:hypothetical protein
LTAGTGLVLRHVLKAKGLEYPRDYKLLVIVMSFRAERRRRNVVGSKRSEELRRAALPRRYQVLQRSRGMDWKHYARTKEIRG